MKSKTQAVSLAALYLATYITVFSLLLFLFVAPTPMNLETPSTSPPGTVLNAE